MLTVMDIDNLQNLIQNQMFRHTIQRSSSVVQERCYKNLLKYRSVTGNNKTLEAHQCVPGALSSCCVYCAYCDCVCACFSCDCVLRWNHGNFMGNSLFEFCWHAWVTNLWAKMRSLSLLPVVCNLLSSKMFGRKLLYLQSVMNIIFNSLLTSYFQWWNLGCALLMTT